jgi:hypothetical protein
MSPSRVLPRQPHHQRADCRPDRWPATGRWSQPRVGPAPGDQLPMPAQQRSWADEPNIPTLPAQQTRQHRQHYPILGLQPRPRDLAAQHRNLMTQNEQLDVLRPLPSTAENDQCKQTPRKRVNHRQHHPAIIPQSGKVRRAEVLEPDRRASPLAPPGSRRDRRSHDNEVVLALTADLVAEALEASDDG